MGVRIIKKNPIENGCYCFHHQRRRRVVIVVVVDFVVIVVVVINANIVIAAFFSIAARPRAMTMLTEAEMTITMTLTVNGRCGS